MAPNFTSDEDEKLIELVQAHPAIFNLEDTDYKNLLIKNNIWLNIAENVSKSALTTSHPKDEFSKYFIIQPQVYHRRYKRALSGTLDKDAVHVPKITLSYVFNDESIVADLKLNEYLIPKGHFLKYQSKNSKKISNFFNKTDINLCHYQGAIRGKSNSRVAVSTCNGINGLIYDGTESYYIYSDSNNTLHGDHYMFRNEDMLFNATCGVDSVTEIGRHFEEKSRNQSPRFRRSIAENTIRGPYNANRHSSYVELVIVVDNKVYKGLGENMKKVHNHCKDIANIVNALYVPLNIFVALVGVVVWNESNEIELSSNGDDTLKNFLHYRRNSLLNHPNDNAQLLTKEQFEGGVVGKALKGPICTYEYSGGVSMEHSNLVAVVATTVAHEMGHNFGMEHDSSDCVCEEEKCIMSASSTSLVPRHWSSCSVDQLNVAFSHGMNYCLRNKPTQLFDSPQCGNGFVEVGEQCDCGLPEFCENSCCDPNTCMLNSNASCATGECCDLTTCRPKNPGTECRSAEEECDLPEYCTGESEYCPLDIFKRDTEECDNGNAYCYKGSCRSRSNQCKILWGPSGESSDHCYGKNIDGTRHGNCGYDRLTNQYVPCAEADVHCGMLHCKHLNERLEFGMESVAILSHSFLNHDGTIIPCRTAIVDLGLQSPDPGLAPNGAKCGENKMCVDQKCVSIGSLEKKGIGTKCPGDCNNQGICNSKGHCHCKLGFAPPDCSNPGQGGSLDSGPASNPNGRIGFTRAMYIFFLGIVPCIAIVTFLTYYWKQNYALQKTGNVNKVTLKTTSPPRMPPSNPNSANDMNSTLLKGSDSSNPSCLHNSMFGKFKGFTLKPLPNSTNVSTTFGAKVALVHPVAKVAVPLRVAPPVPKKNTNAKTNIDSALNLKNTFSSEAEALTNRPVISDPVLKTSTCTAKELKSVNQPKEIDHLSFLGMSQNINQTKKVPDRNTTDRDNKDGTIRRIASFLKNDKKNNTILEASQSFKAKPSMTREKLKNIKISSPIPIIDNALQNDQSNSIQRTQSLRNPKFSERKKCFETFGSMREQGTNRPKSLVGVRPKSPPPRPPVPAIITSSIHMKKSTNKTSDLHPENLVEENLDACESVSNKSENIYADIDDISLHENNPEPFDFSSNVISKDNTGLLGEIVSEIKKINSERVYSNTLNNHESNDEPSEQASVERALINRVRAAKPHSQLPGERLSPKTAESIETPKSNLKTVVPQTTKTGNASTAKITQPSTELKPNQNVSKPMKKYGMPPKKTIGSTPLTKLNSNSMLPNSKPLPKTKPLATPGSKKNLVSQRAEFWENSSQVKVPTKENLTNSKLSTVGRQSDTIVAIKPSTTTAKSRTSNDLPGQKTVARRQKQNE